MGYGYVSALGIELLAAASDHGSGVRIGVLDSGVPRPYSGINRVKWHVMRQLVFDSLGHATEIASVLVGGNYIGGICTRSDLWYIPVLDEEGSGTIESVSNGIYKAIECDVDIINLSLGFARTQKCPKRLEQACKDAFDAGKVIICAAGNDGGPVNWPAALETTISVGSSDKDGLKTSFSSTGEVDFVAPGSELYVQTKDGGVKKVFGTSFSAAIVSGVAALLVAGMHRKDHSPGMKAVMKALRGIAQDVDAPGWDEMTGYGAIGGNGGKNVDPMLCMEIKSGFFGRIVSKLQSIFGFGESDNKENGNGRV